MLVSSEVVSSDQLAREHLQAQASTATSGKAAGEDSSILRCTYFIGTLLVEALAFRRRDALD